MLVKVLSPVQTGPNRAIGAGAEVDASVFGPPSSVAYLIERGILEPVPETTDADVPAPPAPGEPEPPANPAPAQAPRRRSLL